MHAVLLTLAAILTILALWWFIFGSWQRFLKAIEYALTPNCYSWIIGKGPDDLEQTLRLSAFLITSITLIYLEHMAITSLMA